MKKIILVTFMMVLAVIGYAQNTAEKAFSIVITMPDSNGLKEKVLKIITDKDYTLATSKIASVINTNAKTLKNDTRVAFNFQLKGADIILTGTLPLAGQASMKITNQGKKGTPLYNGWEEMGKIAKEFGGSISYK